MDIRPKLSGIQIDKYDEEYLGTALEIYNWLESKKVQGNNGIFYEVNPDAAVDYSKKPVHGRLALYSGSSGIGFFLIRLYEITNNKEYLEEAKLIADELIGSVPGKEFYEDKLKNALKSELPVVGWHTGIYSGPAGAGIYALALYEHTQDSRYINLAKRLGEDIILSSKRDEYGLYLTKDTDIFSDGGFVLYFISLYKATGSEHYIDIARDYASHIHQSAIPYEEGGSYYKANDIEKVGMPNGSIYTGFAHGCAGIGFLFAVLYEYDNKDWELAAATDVARFIDKISISIGNGRVVPYVWGGESYKEFPDKYYVGFCHGPAGTSLLYKKLYDITKDEKYLETVRILAEGVIEAGAPEYNSWGLWNSFCSCCGTPGLIEYFTWMYETTGNEDYLNYAKRAAIKTISDSRLSGKGRCFFGHWDRTDPRDIQTYTGLYTGASGAAANLLRLYSALHSKHLTDFWEYSYI